MKRRLPVEIKVGDSVRKGSGSDVMEVIAFAKMENTGEDVVVYQNERTGGMFVASRDLFMDGRYIKI